jgi:HlyD family secretion protein
MDIQLEKKRFTPRRIAVLAAGLAGLSLLLLALFSSSGNSQLAVEKERLTLSRVELGSFQENVPVSGTVLPVKTIYLDALEGGRVEEKLVEDGAMLERGQPILRLSNTDLELSLVNQETSVYNLLTQMQISQNAARQNTINKRNQLTDIENSLVEARRKYTLNVHLFKEGVVSEQEYLESKNNHDYYTEKLKLAREVLQQDSLAVRQESRQARESYERTRQALELMRLKVEDLVVHAPTDGQITSLGAEVGQLISKGERLGQLDVVSGFKVQALVDEYYISRVVAGQRATFTLSSHTYELEIKKVYTQVVNGRFQVDMHFTGDVPEGIRRGQSLQIKLVLSQEKEALLVPKGSFYQETGGNWIFKLTKDGHTAYRAPIRLGSQNTEYYEVLEGLQPGDSVITSGYTNYKNAEELRIRK